MEWLVKYGTQESPTWEQEAIIVADNLKQASEQAFEMFKKWIDPQSTKDTHELREIFATNISRK